MGKAQAQNGALSGTLQLDTANNPFSPPQTVTFEFSPNNNTDATVFVKTAQISAYNAAAGGYLYQLSDIPYGTYSVAVKLNKWLRAVNTVTVGSSPATSEFYLLGGDTNADNSVDSTDFGNLIGAFNTEADIPDSGYDPNCDFNFDGSVDSTDFGILLNGYNATGAPYQIALTNPPVSASPRQITLQWKLYTSDGSAAIAPPSGTTFNIYRSTSAAHDAGSFFTITSAQYQTDANNVISYTDTLVPGPGEYYYQIVAHIVNSTAPTGATDYYALSNEAQYVPAYNPVIEPNYPVSGVYTITGFQPDLTTINYQATVANGLLNSYKVNGHELFHANLPIQFGPTDYLTLSDGHHGSHNAPSAFSQPDPYTLNYTINDSTLTTQVDYIASTTGLKAMLTANYGIGFCLLLGSERDASANEAVYATQDHASAGVGYDNVPIASRGGFRNAGTGTTYSLPIPCNYRAADGNAIAGLRNLRSLFADGSGVDVTYTLNDPGYVQNTGHLFNYVSPTVCNPYTSWGMDLSGQVEFDFDAYLPAGGATQTPNNAPPFHLYVNDTGAPYDSAGFHVKTLPNGDRNFLYCAVQVDPSVAAALPPHTPYTLIYTYTDFWGNTLNGLTNPITVNSDDLISSGGQYSLTLELPHDNRGYLSGWFRITASLYGSNSNSLLNQDSAEFGVYNYSYSSDVLNGSLNGNRIIDQSEFYADGGAFDSLTDQFYSGNFGHSDPGVPSLLGMQALRVDNGITQTFETSTGSSDYGKLKPRVESATAYGRDLSVPESYEFDRLATFSNPYATQPTGITLIGSITRSGTVDFSTGAIITPFSLADVAFNMAASLTYTPSNTVNSASYNPIINWSLDSEYYPGHYVGNTYVESQDDMQKYVHDQLYPAQQAIIAGRTNPALFHSPNIENTETAIPKTTPYQGIVIMGPNPTQVGDRYLNQGPLSYWDYFLNSTYTDSQGNTKYAASMLDAIGTHSYTGTDRSWEEHGVAESLVALQGRIAAAPQNSGIKPETIGTTNTPKDIWITEHGWNWYWSADLPRLQGEYLVRRYALAAALGIPREHNYYYYGANIGYQYNYEYLWAGVPNRGGMAMRIFNEMTEGQQYDPTLSVALTNNTGKYVHAVPYARTINGDDMETIIVWGNDFNDLKLTPGQTAVNFPLTCSSNELLVYDLMGNSLPNVQMTGPVGGVYTYNIPVTGAPVYVTGLHSYTYGIANGSWPTLTGETNYALNLTGSTTSGPQASASTFAPVNGGNTPPAYNDNRGGGSYFCSPASSPNGPAPNLNDSVWQYDDTISNGQSTPYAPIGSSPAPVKSVWIGNQVYPTATPDFVTIMFPTAKSIDTLVAVVPSSNNSGGGTLCGARDYRFQITTDGTAWTTVSTVTGNTTEWVLHATISLQTIKGMRLIIDNINNGRWYNDYTAYNGGTAYASPMRAMVYELEAYGPQNQ